ncbi:hypothetical protein Tco_1369644 [Tanacetum coccineum]
MWNVVDCDPIVVRELLLGLQPWQLNPDSKCELYTSFVIMLVGVVAAVQGDEDTYAVVRSCQEAAEKYLKYWANDKEVQKALYVRESTCTFIAAARYGSATCVPSFVLSRDAAWMRIQDEATSVKIRERECNDQVPSDMKKRRGEKIFMAKGDLFIFTTITCTKTLIWASGSWKWGIIGCDIKGAADVISGTHHQQKVDSFSIDRRAVRTHMHDYIVIDSPRAVAFRDSYGVQMIMRFNEIHKFNDGTLQQIDEALDYRVKEFRVNKTNPWMNTRFWTKKDVVRSKEFMFSIQKRLKTRCIFRNLESFVGGTDSRRRLPLLKRTE